jgi:hypothetical protein
MPLAKEKFDPGQSGPLDGVRVLDFSRLVAGNMLSLQLADFGASVNLDGKMVDVPVVKRAEVILARVRLIEETEREKAEARARLG